MLKVTDDGITIGLQQVPNTTSQLKAILTNGVVTAFTGILMAINVMPLSIGAVIVLMMIAISLFRQWRQKTNATPILSGGHLRLSSQGFHHQQAGQTTQYQLLASDSVHQNADGISIVNHEGKAIYHIRGFSEAKHSQVAAAILQGKTIQTQARAIKLQSS